MSARLFIAIFFLLTVLPFAQMVTRAIPGDAINENRNLAKRPDLSKGIEHFPRLANEWFNDHFGLRALLIKFKTQIDFSVFGTSDKVVVGRNGWLFYRAVISKEEPLVERLLSQGLEDRIVNGVRNFTDALQAAGIRSVFTINMMSDRFYGDQLPSWVAPRPQRPRIDHLVDRLRALPNVTFVDSTAILRETMKSRQVFFKTDFHWNDPGAFPVAKDIVDKISSAEGLQASLWSHKLETTTETFSGGIATFMPLFSSPSEQALKVKPNFKDPPGARRRYDVGVFEKVMTSDGASPAYLPQTVVVGDSFFDGLEKSGIESYFSGLSRARWRPGVKLSVVAEQMPDNTKWVIVQFIETSTHAMDALADAADVQKAVQIIKQRTARPEQNTR